MGLGNFFVSVFMRCHGGYLQKSNGDFQQFLCLVFDPREKALSVTWCFLKTSSVLPQNLSMHYNFAMKIQNKSHLWFKEMSRSSSREHCRWIKHLGVELNEYFVSNTELNIEWNHFWVQLSTPRLEGALQMIQTGRRWESTRWSLGSKWERALQITQTGGIHSNYTRQRKSRSRRSRSTADNINRRSSRSRRSRSRRIRSTADNANRWQQAGWLEQK